MQNSKPEVFTALQRAHPRVYFVCPDENAVLPAISFMELNNVPVGADDEEYMSAVEIAVDIWGDTGPEEISAIAQAVDAELSAIGGRRTHCTDVPPDDRVFHKNMIYEFLFGKDE